MFGYNASSFGNDRELKYLILNPRPTRINLHYLPPSFLRLSVQLVTYELASLSLKWLFSSYGVRLLFERRVTLLTRSRSSSAR